MSFYRTFMLQWVDGQMPFLQENWRRMVYGRKQGAAALFDDLGKQFLAERGRKDLPDGSYHDFYSIHEVHEHQKEN